MPDILVLLGFAWFCLVCPARAEFEFSSERRRLCKCVAQWSFCVVESFLLSNYWLRAMQRWARWRDFAAVLWLASVLLAASSGFFQGWADVTNGLNQWCVPRGKPTNRD